MSDDTAAAIRDVRKDWISEHRESYLRSGGVQGHIMDITAVGGPALGLHLLLKYRGRKSGKIFITPLCYGAIGGEVVICASKGGSDAHPDWFLNLCEDPVAEFQIATQAFKTSWRVAEGAEHDAVFAYMAKTYPFYAKYQASTSRVIPVVLLTPTAPIPVMREEDATGLRKF